MDTGQTPIGNVKWLCVQGLIADVNASMALENTITNKRVYRQQSFQFYRFHKLVLISYKFLDTNRLH
jgi:hypothetical protein